MHRYGATASLNCHDLGVKVITGQMSWWE